MFDSDFWSRQRVLLTGHTGFKGSWASLWLEQLGAEVAGYALAPDQRPDLFSRLAPFERASSTIADLADRAALTRLARDFRPTLLLHMAAQPLVRRGYADPGATFATNVQGTVHALEAVREVAELEAALVVTTDKVYENRTTDRAFVESDRLGGDDPYSASKAAAELVTASYAACFFGPRGVPLATARAGNVIGGGDWSEDRLVPDIWRALRANRPIALRYPRATRPWQHVLEPLSGYFLYLERLAAGQADLSRSLNFGPPPAAEAMTVAEVADVLGRHLGFDHGWIPAEGDHPPEMQTLALDSSAAIQQLRWHPRLATREAIEWTAQWYRGFADGEDPRRLTVAQIQDYCERA